MSALAPVAPADCVFCRIVDGDAPATVVERWHDAIAIVPRDPVTGDLPNGHLLVIPHRHVTDFTSRPNVTAAVMRRAAELAKQLSFWDDWNLITSAGEWATQTVAHLHVHLVRRREADGLHLPWTGQQRGGAR